MARTFGRTFSSLALGAIAAAGITACSQRTPPDAVPVGITVAENAPPAISGGTLIVARDGHTAIAADPDRDRVWIVDLSARQLLFEVALRPGDEPGRVVEDASGRVHVALRNAGAVATIDVATGVIEARTDVCPAPRGLAFDAGMNAVHVACEGGDLVTLGMDGTEIRHLQLSRDLRDVIVKSDGLLVSRFRSAELVALDANGTVVQTIAPPSVGDPSNPDFTPAVAWRTLPLAGGGAVMVHQRGEVRPIQIAVPGGYGSAAGSCSSIVHGAITVFHAGSNPNASPIADDSASLVASDQLGGALPVDIAASPSGRIAVAMAGTDTVLVTNTAAASTPTVGVGCAGDAGESVKGQPTAVAFDGGDQVVVQTREPAQILLLDSETTIALPGVSELDTGHELFHRPPGGSSATLACASCHPEGREDGRVWHFDPTNQSTAAKLDQPRRTQNLGGRVLDTAPLHWNGDMSDLSDIMGEVFVKRMSGQVQGPLHVRAFGNWIQTLRPVAPSSSASAEMLAEGQQLFQSAELGCTACHSGARLTNDATIDVGTGDHGPEAFQVPSLLGVGSRAPYLHNGAAQTLADRFDPNIGGGEKHGHTSQLDADQKASLVAYLESL